MIAILDTNVIVRFLTGDKNKKFEGVFDFFKSIEQGKIVVELKLIVLFQTIFVLKSYYQVPKDRIINATGGLLKFNGLKIKEKRTVERMLELWHSKNIEIVDAYLIANLEKDSRNVLYSYDSDFDAFEINRIEP
jgi:predicted nucleic acid-binding protein